MIGEYLPVPERRFKEAMDGSIRPAEVASAFAA